MLSYPHTQFHKLSNINKIRIPGIGIGIDRWVQILEIQPLVGNHIKQGTKGPH